MPPNAEETIQARRHRLSLVPRACEACKIRKIRCDRTTPCANCQVSKITCRHPNDRPKGQLQAEKIASLEALVDSLGRRLHDVEAKLAALESRPPVQAGQSVAIAGSRSVRRSQGHDGHAHLFEGDSSFTNQSIQASAAVSASTAEDNDPAVEHSFDRLRKCLHDSHELSESNFFLSKSAPRCASTPVVEFLPATLVMSVLRSMRARRPIFLSSYAISDLQLVESLSRSVYAPTLTGRASVGQIASAHGVLLFILKELIAVKDELGQRFDLLAHLDHCERIFVSALETFEVLAVPKFEHVLALTMGMIKAQGESKPSLFWTLVSAAATQCYSLGYHREASYRDIPSGKADNIRRLFWTVYVFDKNMSLLLGRIPTMQRLQINTRYPVISLDPALRAWDESFIMGIRLAGLQERIFTGLYSTATASTEAAERENLISEIEGDMQRLYSDLKKIRPDGVNGPHVFAMSRGQWDISYYSTLTLLYHSSSRTSTAAAAGHQVRADCLAAARSSLVAHLKCFPQYQASKLLSDGEYMNWILLFSSLTPFLVVFLHAVAAKETESVELLAQVVATLEGFRGASKGSERLYQICAGFSQIASSLVRGPQHPATQMQTQTSSTDALMSETLRASESGISTIQFLPETLEDVLESFNDDVNTFHVTDLLNDWFSGQPFLGNRFDLEMEGEQGGNQL
ncbi:hypothetical protein BDW67DRAFT_190813 [Aspergillus spinulosporus]